MSWEVFVAETMTGRVGPRLDAISGSWDDIVNDPTNIRVRIDTPSLLSSVERWLWSPWSGSLLVCRDGEPIAFGPITREAGGTPEFTELEAGGFWSLMDERIVTARDITDGKELAESTLRLYEGSHGTIARRIVERAQDRPSGALPVSFGSPEELGDRRTREYKGFNLGNNSAGNRLRMLTELENGPDIAFRPRWVDRGHRVEWVMVHGTEAMPSVGQSHYYTIDLTAPKSNVVASRVTASHKPYGRVYATGAGEDEGLLIRVQTGPQRQYLPLLETVIADSQTENADLLDSRARALLGAGRIVQISATIDDPSIPLHTLWAGDEVQVIWPSGWPQLDAGVYRMRVLSRSGDLSSTRTNIEFQAEEMIA